MHKLKRITASLLALLTMGSLSALAACKKDPPPPHPDVPTIVGYGAFASEPTPATGDCVKKGHDYGDTGVCIRCESKAFLAAVDVAQQFPLVEICTHDTPQCPLCNYLGSGKDGYNCLDLEEGCFTVEIGKSGELWLSFPVKAAGQYALHSVDGNNDVKVTRHAANASYVNEKGTEAVVEEGDFYSFVNCGEAYYNEVWRATYCLKGAAFTQVKLRFIRIADAAWEPKNITSKVYATELTQKAQDMSEDKALVDVPYESDYFYDTTAGYYRMGTKEEPGEIIYAAISKPATRLFGEDSTSFTNVLQTSGTALNLSNGTTEDGDYKILNYKPFFMNWIDEDASWGSRPGASGGSSSEEPEGDLTKKCYQNYCNSDGVYPVNKELYEFLVLYTSQNKPTDEALTDVWGTDEDTFSWLSACYYYEQRAIGVKENPQLLTTSGANSVVVKDTDYFFKIDGTGNYTIVCATADVNIIVTKTDGTRRYEGAFTGEIMVSGSDVFELYMNDASTPTVTITVTEVTE